MPPQKRETKLIFKIFDEASEPVKRIAEAIKASVKSITDSSTQATESIKKLDVPLKESGKAMTAAMENLARAAKQAAAVFPEAEQSIRATMKSLQDGSITSKDAGDSLKKLTTDIDQVINGLKQFGAQDAGLVQSLEQLKASLSGVSQEVTGASQSFGELLNKRKALEEFDRQQMMGRGMGRQAQTPRGLLRQAVPLQLRAIGYGAFMAGAGVAVIDRFFESMSKNAERLGRTGAVKSFEDMNVAVRRLTDAVITFNVAGQDAISVSQRAQMAIAGYSNIATVFLKGLQTLSPSQMLDLVTVKTTGRPARPGANLGENERFRAAVESSFGPYVPEYIKDTEERLRYLDTRYEAIRDAAEGTAAAHRVLADRFRDVTDAVRETADGVSVYGEAIDTLTRQAYDIATISITGIDAQKRMALSLGLTDKASQKYQDSLDKLLTTLALTGDTAAFEAGLRRIQIELAATRAQTSLLTGEINTLIAAEKSASKQRGGTLLSEQFTSFFPGKGAVVGSLIGDFRKEAEKAAGGVDNTAERLIEAAQSSWLRLVDMERDFGRRLEREREDYAETQAAMAEQNADKVAEIGAKSVEKRQAIEATSLKRRLDIEANFQKALARVESTFEKARLRALIDRDARALFEAEEARNEGYADASNQRTEAQTDEAADRAEALAKEESDRLESLQKQAESFQKQWDNAAAAFQERQQRELEEYGLRQQDLLRDTQIRLGIDQSYLNAEITLISQGMAAEQIVYQQWYEQLLGDKATWAAQMTAIQATVAPSSVTTLPPVTYAPPGATGRSERGQTDLWSIYGGEFQRGGLIPGATNQSIPAMLHGGEFVVPADLVPALQRLAAGRMQVSLEVRGDGALAQLVRSSVYDAFIQIAA